MKGIDAVISWVDGYDLNYQRKLNTFCINQELKQNEVIEPTRIQQKNEIYYCLHSLKNNAPWIKTIYIITNEQTPPAVQYFKNTPFGQKIKIIDQNDLLRMHDVSTPIFNSISMEWLIWLIPGLSEQFLYLNDDFFILKKVTPEDFFVHDKSVFRGIWKVQMSQKMDFIIKKNLLACLGKKINLPNNPHRTWQEKSARLMGWKKHFYLLPHAPFPLNKNTFTHFNHINPHLFYENMRFPFRNENQTSSIPLMAHKDIKEKRVIFDKKLRSIMVNGACHSFDKIKKHLHYAQHSPDATFLCIQSLDQAPIETQSFILKWLEQHLIHSNSSDMRQCSK